MPDSNGIIDKMKSMVDFLRGSDSDRFPLEQQREGYRLHVQEARANGEEPKSYEEWIKDQPTLASQQK